jgi:predicted GNAT superfamily acetyltransferase
MDSGAITIRRAETPADYRACQEAQRLAWGIAEDGYLVPVATMVAAQHHGGLVLGAFLPDGSAVGMNFAFLGRLEGRLCLYSQLLGIVPGHQDSGLGGRMKQIQRECARADGLEWIAWAFDPLQAGNARFNLDKVGARGVRYVEDMYGPRTDALNVGTPTDRLIVEWPTSGDPPTPIPFDVAWALPHLIETKRNAPGAFLPEPATHVPDSDLLAMEIPADLKHLRATHEDLIGRWRLAVRMAFQLAFAQSYRAVGFARGEVDGERRCVYILSRG